MSKVADQGLTEVLEPTGRLLTLSGEWTVRQARAHDAQLRRLSGQAGEHITLDLAGVTNFDTTGAWLIYRTCRDWRFLGAKVMVSGGSTQHYRLIDHVSAHDAPCPIAPPMATSWLRPIAETGEAATHILAQLTLLLAFLGTVFLALLRILTHPRRIRWNALTHQFEHIGLKALPIVGLLSFLVGLVLVQQGAVQLRQFGAEIFVVDLIGIATLRELGVLLCAIIVAGRSGSAFTAQIGSMKLYEEIDAMRTIGLDPVEVLVVPRVLALIILMPLLTFYGSMMGLLGGAIFSNLQLGITTTAFIDRLHDTLDLKVAIIGLIKAPVFGVLIGVVGCFEGMLVSGGAQSVGEHTTSSVVSSIFLVIVLDAFFAVFFTAINW